MSTVNVISLKQALREKYVPKTVPLYDGEVETFTRSLNAIKNSFAEVAVVEYGNNRYIIMVKSKNE